MREAQLSPATPSAEALCQKRQDTGASLLTPLLPFSNTTQRLLPRLVLGTVCHCARHFLLFTVFNTIILSSFPYFSPAVLCGLPFSSLRIFSLLFPPYFVVCSSLSFVSHSVTSYLLCPAAYYVAFCIPDVILYVRGRLPSLYFFPHR